MVGRMSPETAPFTPETALLRVIHCLDRAFDQSPRTRSFTRALAAVRAIEPSELLGRAAHRTLTEIDGIGDTTAAIITDALEGRVPSYLTKLERDTAPTMSDGAAVVRGALRGDLHAHSYWRVGFTLLRDLIIRSRLFSVRFARRQDQSYFTESTQGVCREVDDVSCSAAVD